MNYKKVFKFYIFSIIFTIILGTLLHFTFEWANHNLFIGAFSSVNESTWEHLKLIFFPMLITIIISHFYLGKDAKKYLCSKTFGIITAMLFITIFFYTYIGILGTNFALLNIASFIFSVLLAEYITYVKMKYNSICNTKVSIVILTLIFISFILFTYFPPKINYFKDPVTNNYGISIHISQ